MSKELEEARHMAVVAMRGLQNLATRHNCPKAKMFTEEFIKVARQGYKIAKMKTK